jgi:hypothetical protein
MAISAEGLALGHRYDSTAVNCPCRQCATDTYLETGEFVTVLVCKYDDDYDEED